MSQLTPIEFLALTSVILTLVGYAPYIIDTITGRTSPQRASWLIWSVLGAIAVASLIYEEAGASLWFAVAQVGGTILIYILSFVFGSGTHLRKSDYRVLAAAAFGLVLWYFTEQAAYALAITITISLLGGMMTIKKAFLDPESETLSTWAIFLGASVLALASVDQAELIYYAYPAYLFTLYLGIVLAIFAGKAVRPARAAEKIA
ncbi:MAG: hypothetical protein AAF429_12350 [Pseudomonadota bacterium]